MCSFNTCNSHRVRNYPEICCEDSDEDEDCIDACRKAPPYCVSRRGCFSTFGGVEFIFIVILAAVAFLGAAALIGYYLNTYGVGFRWRKLSTPESETNEASMNMHSFLETLGFITLTGIAITLFRISNCCDRAGMRVIHLVVIIGAGVLIGLATYLAYEIKEHEKKKHFFSAHSWMGLLAIALFLAEVVFGILKFIVLLACGPISCCLRASCRPIHAAFGIGAFWVAVATAVSGMVRTMMSKAQLVLPTITFYLYFPNTDILSPYEK
ncbi:cytochrome b reductase 1-like isoform X2 [Agrilus planipennis]|uniref:Cytochrome b reductase 1-like isoform X2 n=1 Tax=Agrilus planipennis TaxID=224129 RepID=A0A1W4XHJ2_AGRPL|nr:cytochrome b reductase 1-like isoform X2 [Agrilus planipennis]